MALQRHHFFLSLGLAALASGLRKSFPAAASRAGCQLTRPAHPAVLPGKRRLPDVGTGLVAAQCPCQSSSAGSLTKHLPARLQSWKVAVFMAARHSTGRLGSSSQSPEAGRLPCVSPSLAVLNAAWACLGIQQTTSFVQGSVLKLEKPAELAP